MNYFKNQKFITYLEYRKYCVENGLKPLNRKKTGPFVDLSSILIEKEKHIRNDPSIDEAFESLQENGILSENKIKQLAKKLNFDSNPLLNIFKTLKKDEITKQEFIKFIDQ